VNDKWVPLMMHQPVISTDGGPWATHDMACAVCHERKAILELGEGTFHPCHVCQAHGWDLIERPSKFNRWLGRFLNI
jgi:hypothetical protein